MHSGSSCLLLQAFQTQGGKMEVGGPSWPTIISKSLFCHLPTCGRIHWQNAKKLSTSQLKKFTTLSSPPTVESKACKSKGLLWDHAISLGSLSLLDPYWLCPPTLFPYENRATLGCKKELLPGPLSSFIQKPKIEYALIFAFQPRTQVPQGQQCLSRTKC